MLRLKAFFCTYKFAFVLAAIVIVVLVPTGYMLVEHYVENTSSFLKEVTKHLGSDFAVESHDGYLVAVSPNGTRWPTVEMEEQYWIERLHNHLKVGLVVGAGGLGILFALSILHHKYREWFEE